MNFYVLCLVVSFLLPRPEECGNAVPSQTFEGYSRIFRKSITNNLTMGIEPINIHLPKTPQDIFLDVIEGENRLKIKSILESRTNIYQCGIFRGIVFFLVEEDCVSMDKNGYIFSMNFKRFQKVLQGGVSSSSTRLFKRTLQSVSEEQKNDIISSLNHTLNCGPPMKLNKMIFGAICKGAVGEGVFVSFPKKRFHLKSGPPSQKKEKSPSSAAEEEMSSGSASEGEASPYTFGTLANVGRSILGVLAPDLTLGTVARFLLRQLLPDLTLNNVGRYLIRQVVPEREPEPPRHHFDWLHHKHLFEEREEAPRRRAEEPSHHLFGWLHHKHLFGEIEEAPRTSDEGRSLFSGIFDTLAQSDKPRSPPESGGRTVVDSILDLFAQSDKDRSSPESGDESTDSVDVNTENDIDKSTPESDDEPPDTLDNENEIPENEEEQLISNSDEVPAENLAQARPSPKKEGDLKTADCGEYQGKIYHLKEGMCVTENEDGSVESLPLEEFQRLVAEYWFMLGRVVEGGIKADSNETSKQPNDSPDGKDETKDLAQGVKEDEKSKDTGENHTKDVDHGKKEDETSKDTGKDQTKDLAHVKKEDETSKDTEKDETKDLAHGVKEDEKSKDTAKDQTEDLPQDSPSTSKDGDVPPMETTTKMEHPDLKENPTTQSPVEALQEENPDLKENSTEKAPDEQSEIEAECGEYKGKIYLLRENKCIAENEDGSKDSMTLKEFQKTTAEHWFKLGQENTAKNQTEELAQGKTSAHKEGDVPPEETTPQKEHSDLKETSTKKTPVEAECGEYNGKMYLLRENMCIAENEDGSKDSMTFKKFQNTTAEYWFKLGKEKANEGKDRNVAKDQTEEMAQGSPSARRKEYVPRIGAKHQTEELAQGSPSARRKGHVPPMSTAKDQTEELAQGRPSAHRKGHVPPTNPVNDETEELAQGSPSARRTADVPSMGTAPTLGVGHRSDKSRG